jgi:hypothetical protein
MNRIVLVSALALTLAGCNATVRPAVDVYVPPPRQYIDLHGAVPVPQPRPYYETRERPRSLLVVPPRRCATVWENHRGQYIERRVCGNHIP